MKKQRRPVALAPSLTVRIDDAVYLQLKQLRVAADKSFNDTLRRLLGLPV